MKTLRATRTGTSNWLLTYRGQILGNFPCMYQVETFGRVRDYTHVRWYGIPLGAGSSRTKIPTEG